MILLAAAALANATPAACPDAATPQASVCRAIEADRAGNSEAAARAFEQAAQASASDASAAARAWAAAGNMWITAGEPAKAALDLDKALSGTGLQAQQRGEALLDRARVAEAQGDFKTARAKLTEAARTISKDPFLWYFSAALAIREGDSGTAKQSIDKALALAPADPTILFEAGHVAEFAGDTVGARHYWNRAAAADPKGSIGKAAREALTMLGPPLTVKLDAGPAK